MSLPNDPMMLFSFINMKLRDNYSSLDDLCEDLQVNKKSLLTNLKTLVLNTARSIISSGDRE